MILIGSLRLSDLTWMPPASFWACSQPSYSLPCMAPRVLAAPVMPAVAPILMESWARAGGGPPAAAARNRTAAAMKTLGIVDPPMDRTRPVIVRAPLLLGSRSDWEARVRGRRG